MGKKLFSISLKSLTIVGVLFLVAILFVNLSTRFFIHQVKTGKSVTTGLSTVVVNSGSMEPTIAIDDILLIKSKESYLVGDIITFLSDRDILVTHRIHSLTDSGYITMGDANNIPDAEISPSRVIGKTIRIFPGAGLLVKGLFSPLSILLLFGLMVTILLLRKVVTHEPET